MGDSTRSGTDVRGRAAPQHESATAVRGQERPCTHGQTERSGALARNMPGAVPRGRNGPCNCRGATRSDNCCSVCIA